MDLRLELDIKPWKQQLNIRNRVLLMGSCFTAHMAERLSANRFNVLENPHGILFNPGAILTALEAYAGSRIFEEKDLFYYEGLWQSWMHHGRFAAETAEETLLLMNCESAGAASILRKADWIIITLGSAFVYELKTGTPYGKNSLPMAVANCHKIPQPNFIHRLCSPSEVSAILEKMVAIIRQCNPSVKIIFTISPVRHHREGLVENNRSKGVLHWAVNSVLSGENVFYFPAYELVLDDLRDYRFFTEDMVHPNHLATRYVWEKFSEACIDAESRGLMEKINRLNAAMILHSKKGLFLQISCCQRRLPVR